MSSILSLVHLVRRASPEELPLPDVIQTAAGAQAVNRSSVAALAFLLYDICLTFDDEVELFWPRKWTFMKFNFFFVRYIPLFVQIPLLFVGTELTPYFHFTDYDCFIWQVYQGVASVCIIMSCDSVLLARIYALYYHNARIRYLVSISYILEIAMMSAGLALALPGIHYDEKCTVIFVPESLIVYAGGAVIFQTLLFGLTLYKFLAGVREGWRDIPIVKLLMRDGTWAFFLLFSKWTDLNFTSSRQTDIDLRYPSRVSLHYHLIPPPCNQSVEIVAEVSLYGLKNHAYAGVLYAWLLTGYSVCGYRILLNINHLTRSPWSFSGGSQTLTENPQFTSNAGDTDIPISYELQELDPLPHETELQGSSRLGGTSDQDIASSSRTPV
ncbi:hypothetical protein PQX77_005099 [Marasmius sp. AFHP31]|nr:hypothetical protein PQX77_005099 [Marasmius sp. AFHP31]